MFQAFDFSDQKRAEDGRPLRSTLRRLDFSVPKSKAFQEVEEVVPPFLDARIPEGVNTSTGG